MLEQQVEALLEEYRTLRAEIQSKLRERLILTLAMLAAAASILPSVLATTSAADRALLLNLTSVIIVFISMAQITKIAQVYVVAEYIRTHIRPTLESLVGSVEEHSPLRLGLLAWDDFLGTRGQEQTRLSGIVAAVRRAGETAGLGFAFVGPIYVLFQENVPIWGTIWASINLGIASLAVVVVLQRVTKATALWPY